MSERYFVIRNSDGDTYVTEMSREELLKQLHPEELGSRCFLTGIYEADTSYWGNGVLIIKGEIVVPKPVEVVRRFDI